MSELVPSTVVFDALFPAKTSALDAPYPYDMWLASSSLSGAETDTQPVSGEAENAVTAFLSDGVNRHYLYDRIIVDPRTLELGNLVSAQNRLVSVWNGFFSPQDVTAFAANGSEGITVTEPDTIPYVLSPLEEVFYEFQVSLDGPASVNASYTLTIEGEDYQITITGSRVVLWPFSPNWQSSVNESLEWMTQIFTSHNRNEQRYALRSVPRRRLEYSFFIRNEESQRFDNIVWGWQNRAFAVPLWQYKCKLTGAANVGSTSVPFVTESSSFVAGQTAVLLRDGDYYEVVEIDSVSTNSIDLARPLQLDWGVGDVIYPVMIGNFESNIPITRLTSDKLTGRAMFMGDPSQTDPYTPSAAATDLYNGKEIILVQPDWSGGVDNSSTFENSLVDASTGVLDRSTTHDTATQNKRYRWHLQNRAQVREFRSFLARLRGRNRAIYIPSWHDDFTLTQDIGIADVTVFVKDVQFFNLVGTDPARAHFMIRTRDGQRFIRPMNNIGRTGNELSINIGTALGVAVPMTNCKAISVVMLYRLASDRVNFDWRTNGVAVVEADFISVKS